MKKQRPLVLIILLLYIFVPDLMLWVTHENGQWYRPFTVWLMVIAIAFMLQRFAGKHDDV